MNLFPECIKEYRAQLMKGAIQLAYRYILEIVNDLKIYFVEKVLNSPSNRK